MLPTLALAAHLLLLLLLLLPTARASIFDDRQGKQLSCACR